jgi:hypothetical protein
MFLLLSLLLMVGALCIFLIRRALLPLPRASGARVSIPLRALDDSSNNGVVLVTGAGGFVGRYLVEQLLVTRAFPWGPDCSLRRTGSNPVERDCVRY